MALCTIWYLNDGLVKAIGSLLLKEYYAYDNLCVTKNK